VTHHPFDLPERYDRRDLVGRAHMAMPKIARCGIDLLLAGHFHVSHSGPTAARYQIPGHSAIFVQAGTMSTRGRGEPNSFNAIRVEKERIAVQRYTCGGKYEYFRVMEEESFRCTNNGWSGPA
jgi:hypothetical protein